MLTYEVMRFTSIGKVIIDKSEFVKESVFDVELIATVINVKPQLSSLFLDYNIPYQSKKVNDNSVCLQRSYYIIAPTYSKECFLRRRCQYRNLKLRGR